jgi:hypothetical protein
MVNVAILNTPVSFGAEFNPGGDLIWQVTMSRPEYMTGELKIRAYVGYDTRNKPWQCLGPIADPERFGDIPTDAKSWESWIRTFAEDLAKDHLTV